ncbi:hypothetical protein, partial [Aeromonas simiae]|uniref:hypothetical protein n=1 Tax=Aeromonas simiae TaxID=218936 RepID=UPI00266C21D6
KKDNSSRLNRLNELSGYVAEIYFTVSGGVLTTQASDSCSITRTQAGVYQVTFTTTMPDTQYRVEPSLESGATPIVYGHSGKSTASFNVTSRDFAGTATDCVSGSIKVFR